MDRIQCVIFIGIVLIFLIIPLMLSATENQPEDEQENERKSDIPSHIREYLPDTSSEPKLNADINEIVEFDSTYLDVPESSRANTGAKYWMPYWTITDDSTIQWALQQKAKTDPETGIRTLDNCYMIALGTFYSPEAGMKFHITLDSGVEFDAITGDIKSDRHTDRRNQHSNGCIIEFIVDPHQIPKKCLITGDMSFAGFEGKVEEIRRIEE